MSNAPNIRFKGFTEPWEQRNVGDFTSVLSASRVHKDEWESDGIPFFRSSDVVSAFKGTDNEKAYISQELYEKLIKFSGKLEEGDILITGGGSIGIPYIVPNNAPLYTKDADLIWIKKSINHSSRYLYTYFTGMQFQDYISSISHVGTIAHYTIEQVKNTPVLMPNMDEQKAIGDFLSHIDYLIILHQRKYKAMSELKKYMLQKMFPRKGEQLPEIRFSGFTDPWEQRKLYEVAELNPKSELPNEFEYVDLESVVGTEMISHRTETKESAPSRAQRLAQTGDVFFQTVRPYQRNNYLFSKPDKNYVFSTGYAQMRPHIDTTFLMSFLQTDSFVKVVLDNCTGTSYPAISSNDLSNLDISLPDSKEEQRKIGGTITKLDHLITLRQRKCEELKSFKKFMLQNMFPQKG